MTKIYIGNLSFKTTEDDLRALFSQYGGVESVSIATDRSTGQSRGFAFVEMSAKNDAESAISALNGTDLNGRAINVNEARPKTENRQGNRGGGGGYGRGSGSRW